MLPSAALLVCLLDLGVSDLTMLSHLIVALPVFLILLQVVYQLFCSYTSPLGSVPGPFLARITKLWYFCRVWNGHFEEDNIALHHKYGKT